MVAQRRDPVVAHVGLGSNVGDSPGTLRAAVHRLRKRYRALLRDELGQTLGQPEMVEEELRALRQVLAA